MQSSLIAVTVGLLALPFAVAQASGPDASGTGTGGSFVLAQSGGSFSDTVNGRPLVAAPVPTVGDQHVSPVDRFGSTEAPINDSGPVDANPFSGPPSAINTGPSPQARVDPVQDGERTPDLNR